MVEPSDLRRPRKPAWQAGLFASGLALLIPTVYGSLSPGYSQISNYISELGEHGSPYALWVNWAGFLPVGLLVFWFLFTARGHLPSSDRALWLLSATGWGYVISACFPCDAGCPYWGSTSQLIHNLATAIAYPATAAGLARMAGAFAQSPKWKKWYLFSLVCSAIVAVGFTSFLFPASQPFRGLTQRFAEGAIFGWIAVMSLALRGSTRRSADSLD